MSTKARRDGSLLTELEQRARGRVRPGAMPRWTPTVQKISDPREDVESVLKILDAEVDPSARRSSLMQRYYGRESAPVDRTASGVVVFEGRPCCIAAMEQVQARLHMLRIPVQFTCDACGTVYEIVGMMR